MAKKVKEESALKKKIKEMKKTPKGKAILKLIGWGIFFFLLFIFCLIASLFSPKENLKEKEENNNATQVTPEEALKDKKEIIEDIKNNLLKSNYDYKYEITFNEEKYTYEGAKTKLYETGYKTNNTGIIKYYIDETGTYREFNEEKTLINDLYQNINTNYLDLNYLFNILNFNNLSDANCSCLNGECTCVAFSYKDHFNEYYIAYYNTKDIFSPIYSIVITSTSYKYNLTYKNVGGLNET